MMEILDLTLRNERIYTMKLAFRSESLEMVMMDLRFDGNRLNADISVPNEQIRCLFEDEIYDFLYRFKKNSYIISSLNIHVEQEETPVATPVSRTSELREKWLKAMEPRTGTCHLDAFA